MKKTLCFFALFYSFFFFGKMVYADENFDAQLHSTYTVTANGLTTVQQKFQLTNKNPTKYVKQYALEVGATKLQNISAFDANGSIPIQVVTAENKTSIALTFADEVVGEGKSRSFTIQFSNPDTAIISGSVLEVYVPRIANIQDYSKYSVTLNTPLQYWMPARISPKTYTVKQEGQHIVLQFDALHGESITALFGQKQIFDYTLRYNLENPTGNTGIIQVALPPDTVYQKMLYNSIEPPPKEMTRDADGNWIATYEIAAQNNTEVYVNGKVFISLEPQNTHLTQPNPTSYTQPQEFWETTQTEITAKALEKKTPRAIYDFVVSTLSYDYTKVNGTAERLGALAALHQPTHAACQEFTDLFIALARSAGIPARRNIGFAYTANGRLRPLGLVQDVLHAWPEYYDLEKKNWIPVDPTWGSTTGGIDYFDQFDFNHFVFAINGASSVTPYSAGSYKRGNEQTKDVEVSFGKDQPLPEEKLVLKLNPSPRFVLHWPLRQKYTLSVTNLTGAAFYRLPLQIKIDQASAKILSPVSGAEIEYILPFQTQTMDIVVESKSVIRAAPLHLTVQVGSILSSYAVTSGFNSQIIPALLPGIGVGIGMVILTALTWRLLVSRRKR